jgi:hypothetical protein
VAGRGETPGSEREAFADGDPAEVPDEIPEEDGAGTPVQEADPSIAAVTASVTTVL